MAYETYYHSLFKVNGENQYVISNMNYNSTPYTTSVEPMMTLLDSKKKTTRRSKHIPHHLRPQHLVEKRNRRERKRVKDVNQAFVILQALLPLDTYNNNKEKSNSTRISKVYTLRKAIDYIEALQNILNETD
ncbi:unnamed protein product [Rotaria socialis]|uniref:BHLH domain-containing protein n=1 Tax=Rotaria socialis TaxID=392032 RepID=A0A817Q6C8_9BILA|nr:unnamed protein product [Rotaria socialis]CAF4334693.1 unnamed protein product [Rotaria socialis]